MAEQEQTPPGPEDARPPPEGETGSPLESTLRTWAWLQGQIAALWAALQALPPGHSEEQLRAIVATVVRSDQQLREVVGTVVREEVHKAVKEEVVAAMKEMSADLVALQSLVPDLREMVRGRHQREAAEAHNEALWAEWRKRISATMASIPQFLGLLLGLVTMSQFNRQGLLPDPLFWTGVVLVSAWGLWLVYSTLLRPAQARRPRSRRDGDLPPADGGSP